MCVVVLVVSDSGRAHCGGVSFSKNPTYLRGHLQLPELALLEAPGLAVRLACVVEVVDQDEAVLVVTWWWCVLVVRVVCVVVRRRCKHIGDSGKMLVCRAIYRMLTSDPGLGSSYSSTPAHVLLGVEGKKTDGDGGEKAR